MFHMQWLPQKWQTQSIFLVYRWIFACYFLGWLIASTSPTDDSEPKYLIYLTNWSMIMWVAYLLVAAILVTVKLLQVNVFQRSTFDALTPSDNSAGIIDASRGCCGVGTDGTNWYHKVQWLLFTIAGGAALTVTILYWSLLYNDSTKLDGVNINVHLTTGIMAVVDIWISGTPIRIYHTIYLQLYGVAFTAFSGIYFAADGKNSDDDPYIYEQLDYESHPGKAAVTVIATILGLPIIHLLFYIMYVLRFYASRFILQRCAGGIPQFEEGSNNSENIELADSIKGSLEPV